MGLLAWFKQLVSTTPPVLPPTRAARPEPLLPEAPYDLVVQVGTEYATDARQIPASQAPEVPRLVQAVREAVAQGKVELPPFSPLAAQIFGTIEHPDFDLNHLVSLVRRDPAVAAEVLAVANSMLFAASEPVENIRDAVVRLGARETAQAVSAVSVRALFDLETRASQDLFPGQWHRQWHHAMVCGFTASWASMTFHKGDMDRVFLCGMLHDIGKSLGLRALSGLVLAGEPIMTDPVIHAVLEEVHVELALQVARKWHLTDVVLAVLRDHHDAELGDENLELVRLVSALKELSSNPFHREGLKHEVHQAVMTLGLSGQQQRALVTQLREVGQRVSSLI